MYTIDSKDMVYLKDVFSVCLINFTNIVPFFYICEYNTAQTTDIFKKGKFRYLKAFLCAAF